MNNHTMTYPNGVKAKCGKCSECHRRKEFLRTLLHCKGDILIPLFYFRTSLQRLAEIK